MLHKRTSGHLSTTQNALNTQFKMQNANLKKLMANGQWLIAISILNSLPSGL